jgi:glycosyltransferase involved in cell wall biosynthesis
VGLLLLEFRAGRSDGHNDHYLRSLEDVFHDWPLKVWAPYRDGWARAGRLGSLVQQLALAWRAFHPPKNELRVVIVQNPWAVEKLLLTLASLWPRRRVIAVFVLRRTGDDAHALAHPWSARAARIARVLVARLIRRGWLYPVSDSSLALDDWRSRGRVWVGSLVALPPPPGLNAGRLPTRSGGPVVALVGSFRTERGAPHYNMVIEAAVELLEDVTLDVQLGGQVQDGSVDFAESVRLRWRDDPRVRLHARYLADAEYVALLARADVVVLPYDATSYTTGTSGVLHEAVALGATVLTAPLAWATKDYAGHPRVHFIDRWDPETLRRELPGVTAAAVATRQPPVTAVSDDFARSWGGAVSAAVAQLRSHERS